MLTYLQKAANTAGHVTRTYATSAQLKIFDNSKHAAFLAAAGSVESLPIIETHPPEIVVTGRANVGKSTLLNAVLGRKDLVHTSKKAGRTQTLNFFRVGPEPAKLVVVDAPGYGVRGRPEWGKLFDHYVTNRQELKRIYLLINTSHGLKYSDQIMLKTLNQQVEEAERQNRAISLQAVFTKCDTVRTDAAGAIEALQREVFRLAPLCLPGIATAVSGRARLGIDPLRESIVDACGLGRVSGTVQHA